MPLSWRVEKTYSVSVLQPPTVETFLGVDFHVDSLENAARDIVLEAQTCSFRYVVTPNVQHVVAILRDPVAIAPLYRLAWRVYCDSKILNRLALHCGRNLPVVTGSDLTAKVLEIANTVGLKIALVGPSWTDCAKLQALYPRLHVVCHTPPWGFMARAEEIDACIDFVKRERASLVFLAVGMPRQEILAGLIALETDVPGIGLCVGASIDFLTGKQNRAPPWMQKAGLEWLHRLSSDPVRLAPRYLWECPKILFPVLREIWHLGPPRWHRLQARKPHKGGKRL